MEQAKEIIIALKFADIDNTPYPNDQEGWVSGLVKRLKETLAFYFRQPIRIVLKKETEPISEAEFKRTDAIILILSPAFMLSSNLASDMAAIEKAFIFNIDYINAKIHKVLKGPIQLQELPASISLGSFHHFYQTNATGDSGYETLFDWDREAQVRAKYWESFTNLLFDLLKHIPHEKKERFIPKSDQTVYLGTGELDQLWSRINLYGELHSRGIKVLPDHDHSIEVKYLNEPLKFYLQKSTLAIHFPEEFLPLSDKKLKDLAEMSSLKRYIWFNPEVAKNVNKKKQYDELRQKLKNLEHVEAVTSGIEELKEIIFAGAATVLPGDTTAGQSVHSSIYLLVAEGFDARLLNSIMDILRQQALNILLMEGGNTQEIRLRHHQNLKNCDYCLICDDGRNQDWLRANINEVKKAAGLNPERRLKIKLGIVTLASQPTEVEPDDASFTLITGTTSLLEENLNRFVDEK